ncbi:MAG: hypothetical protein RL732_494 [Bacteroidota bacterium]|jgi:hypothetical protein
MLQRIQSLWLACTAVLALLSVKFPVFSGNLPDGGSGKQWVALTAVQHTGLLILTVAIAVVALLTLFLYKQRKLQIRLTVLNWVGSLALIAGYHHESRQFIEGNFNLYALTILALPVLLLLALRGIYRDEQLVKSADKLR